ncbi:CaiB/BaiF CoA transferase family protein [Zeimonas arvi]|uniref:CoA transferase n=1 Tax=Zeimonas arvi TaxID=2498847 RepID=A0A5C8NTJ4_9BURK|nr:CoA transferase [Zeimonas arvi]TXL64588.1 CoA transferase [Zeimonas arvi]
MNESTVPTGRAPALPLSGLKVLDLSRALAGPFCGMILADLGADVIKVEPPDGEMVRTWGPFQDGISVYYLSIHRNKRSVALDFRDPRGLELLREMAAGVDILVENFKPGVMEAMGMAYETLRERNPGLVFASITGFGRGGPYSDWPGMDQIAQGMSGLMSLTGQPESGPTRVGIPIGDVVGGMWATLGIQAAIIERQRTGQGQRIDISLLGGLVGLLTVQGQRQLSLGQTPGVAGNDHPVICPYGTFAAADGPFNMAGATDDMWASICRLVGLEELIDHPDFDSNTKRAARRDEVKRRLNERFATRGKMEWTQALVKLGVPAGPILDLQQVFSDPHVRQTGMVEEIEHPTIGRLEQLANPIRMSSLGGRSVRRAPPLLGQDTAAVLEGFGLPPERIQALLDAGVVRGIEQGDS